MSSDKELIELASQLRQPSGNKGIEIADMMNATNINMTIHSIKRLTLSSGNSVLELGHGNCGHLTHLMEQSTEMNYTGLELSELMHQEAQRINQLHIENKQAAFHLYDGEIIPFDDNSFDKIFTVNTIYFWPQPVAMLNELYRVLKPQGLLNITFAERSFMQQLPFTQFGFELYDSEKIKELISQTQLQYSGEERQSESIKTKTGELVTREFTTMSLMKE